MEKTLVCVTCPTGCELRVVLDGDALKEITGNRCKRGEAFALEECTRPVRTLTTSVRLQGAARPLLPVRTSAPVPRDSLAACAKAARALAVSAPVAHHQVVCHNLAGTGADLIACMEVDANAPN